MNRTTWALGLGAVMSLAIHLAPACAQPMWMPVASFPARDVRSVAASASEIYVATYGDGLLRSSDGGVTWNETGFVSESDIVGWVACLNGRVYASGFIDGSLYWRGTGDTEWKDISIPLTTFGVGWIVPSADGRVFASDARKIFRRDSTAWSTVFVARRGTWVHSLWSDQKGGLVAGLFRGGLVRTSDYGDSWDTIAVSASNRSFGAIASDGHGNVFAAYQGGVLRTSDGWKTWAELPSAVIVNPREFAFLSDRQVLLACGRGVARSLDSGRTWTLVNQGFWDTLSTSTLTLDSAGRLFLGSGRQGLFRYDESSAVEADDARAGSHRSPALVPNPARDFLRVEFGRAPRDLPCVISVINLRGELVSRRSVGDSDAGSIELDVSTLPPGPYFVVVRSGATTSQKSLFVVR